MSETIDISGLTDEQRAQLSRIVNLLRRSDQPLEINQQGDPNP